MLRSAPLPDWTEAVTRGCKSLPFTVSKLTLMPSAFSASGNSSLRMLRYRVAQRRHASALGAESPRKLGICFAFQLDSVGSRRLTASYQTWAEAWADRREEHGARAEQAFRFPGP